MNIIYEFMDEGRKPVYVIQYNVSNDSYHNLPAKMKFTAHRIWKETDTDVIYLKNRWQDTSKAAVDMGEFMWIKLKAEPISIT